MADRPLAEDQFSRLEALSRDFRPFSDARVEIVRQAPDSILKGVIGGYGRITGAPAFAIMIGSTTSPRAAEHVGYVGEALLLEATAMGLGTCWVSGFFRRNSIPLYVQLAPDEIGFAVTPLGYGERVFTLKERLYIGAAGSRSRKRWRELIEGSPPRPWQEKALEAACLAPSARNRQPWRFHLTPGTITVRTDSLSDGGRYPKRLDCGIAMLHLELGARSAGGAGRWTALDPPDVARFEKCPENGPGPSERP